MREETPRVGCTNGPGKGGSREEQQDRRLVHGLTGSQGSSRPPGRGSELVFAEVSGGCQVGGEG